VKCAYISNDDSTECWILKQNYTQEEYKSFLSSLDFEYDDGYGLQQLFGIVWFTDDTWLERGEYDGSEWWEYNKTPEIPKECQQPTEQDSNI
jgi:hypothetical protein